MKRILITGANSYIGTSFEKWMSQYDGYEIDTMDMIDGSWREYDFFGYDVVFHVAGIAHSDIGKVDEETKSKYYKINTDLTVEVAKKAKDSRVKQFVFMSSMIVYGSKNNFITIDTEPNPDNFYGDSKLKADKEIHKMQNESFNVVSIRPPMIYGKDSKGNYPRLAKLAKITPVFPDFKNQRSMLYINNLCEFVRMVIDNNETGIFHPQNKEYVNTTDLVCQIAAVSGKKIHTTKLFNVILKVLIKRVGVCRKVFGNMVYDKELSKYKDFSYCIADLERSIRLTEE